MIQHLKKGQSAQTKADNNTQVRNTVEAILAAIEQRGDAAVREYSQKFDKWSPASFRLSAEEIAACMARLSRQTLDDIRYAALRKFSATA